ncbi:hypothetical protein C8Q78DRAFT_1063086 [Trametes maxima]|nr:hypothetical protein C8Q78DRAFT_1063086 [Trametes maxima]
MRMLIYDSSKTQYVKFLGRNFFSNPYTNAFRRNSIADCTKGKECGYYNVKVDPTPSQAVYTTDSKRDTRSRTETLRAQKILPILRTVFSAIIHRTRPRRGRTLTGNGQPESRRFCGAVRSIPHFGSPLTSSLVPASVFLHRLRRLAFDVQIPLTPTSIFSHFLRHISTPHTVDMDPDSYSTNPSLQYDLWLVSQSLRTHFTIVVVSTSLWSLYSILFVVSMIVLGRCGWNQRGPRFLGSALCLLYILDTFCWILMLYDLYDDVVHVQQVTRGLLHVDPRRRTVLRSVPTIALALMVAIEDAVVWWRAYVLFPNRRAILAATIAFPTLVLMAGAIPTIVLAPGRGAGSWATPEGYAGSCLSFASNFMVTVLIGRKAWKQRRSFRKYLAHASSGTPVHKIMMLLFESGVLYCTLWIVVLIIQSVDIISLADVTQPGNPYFGVAVFFEGSLPSLVAMYPTAFILLVSLHAYLDARRDPHQRSFSLAFPSSVPDSGSLPHTDVDSDIPTQTESDSVGTSGETANI